MGSEWGLYLGILWLLGQIAIDNSKIHFGMQNKRRFSQSSSWPLHLLVARWHRCKHFGNFGVSTLCVRGLLRIGLFSKDLNINPGTYLGKGAAAGVQDVRSPETYHFPPFLEETQSKITRYRSRMLEVITRCWNFRMKALKGLRYHHNGISWNCDCQPPAPLNQFRINWQTFQKKIDFNSDRGQSMDRAWKNLSRAWKDLSRAWKDWFRAWTGVPGFSTYVHVFSLTENLRIPTPKKLGNNLIGNKFMHGMMDMFALTSSHADDGLTKT